MDGFLLVRLPSSRWRRKKTAHWFFPFFFFFPVMNESTAGTQDCWGVTRDGLLVSAAIYLNAENSPEKIKKQRQTVCGQQCQVSGGNMKLARFQWSLLYETTLIQWQRPDTSVGNIRTTAPMQVPKYHERGPQENLLFFLFVFMHKSENIQQL